MKKTENSKAKRRKYPIAEFLIFFFAFFPYITVIPLPTDIQLYCLIFSFIFCIYLRAKNRLKLNDSLYIILFTAILACIIGLISGFDMDSLRGVANYLSLAFISIAFYNLFLTNGLPEKYCKIFIWIWFFVGAIQFLFDSHFLSAIVSNARTTEERGVFGLASEPSFYGITMSLTLFLIKDFKTRKYFYILLVSLQTILFAQSMMGIVFLLTILIMIFLGDVKKSAKNIGKILLVCLLLLFAVMVLLMEDSGQRVAVLIRMIFNGTLFEDLSVIERWDSIIYSFKTFYNNCFMPSGFSSRIMSGFGGIFVELGIFGIPLVVTMCISVTKTFRLRGFKWAIFILFFMLMLMAIQPAHPLVACIIGYGLYKSDKPHKVRQTTKSFSVRDRGILMAD